MRRMLRSSQSVSWMPPSLTSPVSGSVRPRKASWIVVGCSKISFSMKCSKPPFWIWPRSQVISWTSLVMASLLMVIVCTESGRSTTISPSSR